MPFGTAPSAQANTLTAKGSNDETKGEATASAGTGQGDITITLPTAYTGSSTSQNFNYKVYKVFDATVNTTEQGNNPTAYTYSLKNGKTDVPTINGDNISKFIKDDANNIYYGKLHDEKPADSSTAFQITVNGQEKWLVPKTGAMSTAEAEAANSAIRAYLNLNDSDSNNDIGLVADVNVANTFSTLKITGLDYGYYYITTTAGAAIALTSTNPNATISSKNDVPSIDKTITKVDDGVENSTNSKGSVTTDGKSAIAELGSTVHYQSVIHVKKGATNYVFRDKMEDELAFDTQSIKVQTKVGGAEPSAAVTATDNINQEGVTVNTYKATTTASTTGDDQYTFKIEFDNTWISNLANQTGDNGATDVQIIITYTAKVTSGALQSDPADNSATISYGEPTSHTSDPSITHVRNAKFTVNKYIDNNGSQGLALAGAEFVLKNGDLYYKYTMATEGDNPTPAKVEWVSDVSEATKLTSDSNGALKSDNPILGGFVGITNGSYTLHETKAPDGYNTTEDSTFTVKAATEEHAFDTEGEHSNLVQSKTVLDRPGTELPTTGGPGTAWMYALGALLVAAAAVGLIVRRRMRQHQ